MFTLYRIGFCSVSKVVPVQCEQELMFCCPGGVTCQNFDRDAHPIFFGLEIWPNPIFLGWQFF